MLKKKRANKINQKSKLIKKTQVKNLVGIETIWQLTILSNKMLCNNKTDKSNKQQFNRKAQNTFIMKE